MVTLISSCGYCYSGYSVVWISHGVSVSFHIPSRQDTSLHSSSFILVHWGCNLLFCLPWRPLPLDLEDSILRVFHLHWGVVTKLNKVSDHFASIACRVVNVPLQHIGKDLLFS